MTTADNPQRRYTELLQTYRLQILSYCWKHGRDVVDCELLLDRVMQNIWKGMRTLRADSSPRQRTRWLQVVMRHALADHRDAHREVPVRANLDARPLPPADDYDRELLDALLQHLRDDEREFLEERFQGYSPAEQAQRRGMTVDAIHHRYSRLVKKLRTIYQKYYAE